MRTFRFFAAALLYLLFGLCVLHFPASAQADFTLIVASDLHYIAPSLTDGGACYQRVLQAGDSKFMPQIEAITDAFLDEVLEASPDALVLTGDLTFNGALQSHEALIEKLRRLETAGIPVLVLTGNHDLYNTNAAAFHGDDFTPVTGTTTESFSALYAEFGLSEALSVDPDSLSYLYPLNDTTRLLMLDLNTAHDFCGISESSLRWVEQQLREAKQAGVRVLAAGHQNLFQHSIFRGGYVIQNAEKLSSLFRRCGVPLYLSGHLHIQHILTQDGLTEITTSALCSYPCQYGVLHASDAHLHYETRKLDMAAWAVRNGQDAGYYGRFLEEAAAYMTEHFSAATLPPAGVSWEQFDVMSTYLQALNLAYFAGDLRDAAALDPSGSLAALWLEPGDLTSLYVASLQKDIGKNFCIWDSK